MKNLFFATVFLCGALSAHAIQKVPAYQVSVDDAADGSGLVFDAQSNPGAGSPAGTLQRFINNLEVDETILRKSELESEFNTTFPDIVPTVENSLSTNVTTTTSDPGEAGDVTVTGRDLEISFPSDYKTVEEVVVENENPGVGEVEFTNQTLTVTFPQVLTNVVVEEDFEDGSVEYDAGTLTVAFPTEKGVTNLIVDTDAEANNASLDGNDLTIEFTQAPEVPPVFYRTQGFVPKYNNATTIFLTPGHGSLKGKFFYETDQITVGKAGDNLTSNFDFGYVYLKAASTNNFMDQLNDSGQTADVFISIEEPVFSPFYGQWYNGVGDLMLCVVQSPNNVTEIAPFFAYENESKTGINYYYSDDINQTANTFDSSSYNLSYAQSGVAPAGTSVFVHDILNPSDPLYNETSNPLGKDKWFETQNALADKTPVNATKAELGIIHIGRHTPSARSTAVIPADFVAILSNGFGKQTPQYTDGAQDWIQNPAAAEQMSLYYNTPGAYSSFQTGYRTTDNDADKLNGSSQVLQETFTVQLAESRNVKIGFWNVGKANGIGSASEFWHIFRLHVQGVTYTR